jgi:hypothetical protein
MDTFIAVLHGAAMCGPSFLGHIPGGMAVEALRCLSLALRAQAEELRLLLLLLLVVVSAAAVFMALAGTGLIGQGEPAGAPAGRNPSPLLMPQLRFGTS